jgi:hypothetical protein
LAALARRWAVAAEAGAEVLVEALAELGRRGGREAGAVALGFGGQRELADDEGRAADVEERAVHPALGVAEDAQVRDLAGEARRARLGIALHGADEHDQAFGDGAGGAAVDRDARLGGALDEGAHQSRSSVVQRRNGP